MILNLKKISIFSLIVVFGVCGFTFLAQSKSHEPEVIFVGNPSTMSSGLQSKLPTGYKWMPEMDKQSLKQLAKAKKRALKSGETFVTPDSNFPYMFVMLNQQTDLQNIINQARDKRKKAVYVFEMAADPRIPVVPITIDLDKVWSMSIDSIYSWADSINNYLITEASANAYPDSSCSSGVTVYAGTCLAANWVDDVLSDGKTPGALYCFHYTSRKCHWYNYGIRIYKNIAAPKKHSQLPHTTFTPEPVSFVSCMKGHNGDFWINRPIDLTINIYKTAEQVGAAPGSCGFQACGCGQQPPKTVPRSSEGRVIWIASEDQVCNAAFSSLETVRHEVSHNYGYQHSEMDINVDEVAHCINAGRDANQNLQFPPLHTIF